MSSPVSSANAVDAEAARVQLQRILASDAFSSAPILSDFLRYVVESWIDGRGIALKEYTIAVEVFRRGKAFDSDVDTIVRVSARRLRARLAMYYEDDGRDDPLRITMPKGHYSVEVVTRAAAEAASASAESSASESSPRLTICVLPFANMSGDPEQEYFSDGITEDIITDLSKVSALRVASRNSSFMYKGQHGDIRRMACELKVSHVLSGSVRRDGGRVRISAQLIDGETNNHVWAERYDRDASDIFALTDEISQTIVKALQLELLPEEKQAIERRGTGNMEAHSLYLMARQIYVTHLEIDERATRAFVRLCARATEVDPNYAQAWALMAMGYRGLHELGVQSDDGMEAVERALALDPGLADAYAVRAYILQVRGALDNAVVEARVALDLDRDSYEANRTAGRLAYQLHRFDDAVWYYEKATSLMDSDLNSAMMLVSCHRAMGNDGAVRRAAALALRRADKVLAHDRTNPMVIAYGANALAALGEGERAKARAHRALLIDPDNWNMRYNFACAMNMYLGDKIAALDMLEPLFDAISAPMLRYMKDDPDLGSLHDDPRYRAMVASAETRHAAAAKSPIARSV
ncbi:MAG: hypothetical protein ACREPS_01435 [Rhodanobacteraceae bacterium]